MIRGIRRYSEEWFLIESIYARNMARPGATDRGVRQYIEAVFGLSLGK